METDQGAAALVKDLKSRGLLDTTIVMWAGEFGLAATTQNGDGRTTTATHSPSGSPGRFQEGNDLRSDGRFWIQGCSRPVGVPDMTATATPSKLGLDHKRVLYPHGGRLETPSDVTVTGAKVVGGNFTKTRLTLREMMRRSFHLVLFVWLVVCALPVSGTDDV
jgi:hypothetical protein